MVVVRNKKYIDFVVKDCGAASLPTGAPPHFYQPSSLFGDWPWVRVWIQIDCKIKNPPPRLRSCTSPHMAAENAVLHMLMSPYNATLHFPILPSFIVSIHVTPSPIKFHWPPYSVLPLIYFTHLALSYPSLWSSCLYPILSFEHLPFPSHSTSTFYFCSLIPPSILPSLLPAEKECSVVLWQRGWFMIDWPGRRRSINQGPAVELCHNANGVLIECSMDLNDGSGFSL